jgi:hypothetical protein
VQNKQSPLDLCVRLLKQTNSFANSVRELIRLFKQANSSRNMGKQTNFREVFANVREQFANFAGPKFPLFPNYSQIFAIISQIFNNIRNCLATILQLFVIIRNYSQTKVRELFAN